MKRKYIKMNDLYNHLSLGNVILVIKNEAKNKTSAIQSEVFCALFDVDDINETTVNNYSTGYRAIGNQYIQKYINLQNKFKKDNQIFEPIIFNILNIVEGVVYKEPINSSAKLKQICLKLYNIAKNDVNINSNFTKDLYNLITNNNVYESFIKIIVYAVLDNKQPIYKDEKNRKTIEIVLENTDISANDLEKFLLLKLKEGINFNHSMKLLAKENNPYAYFELATMEYTGEVTGKPRYKKSYDLFLKAAENNHPAANWMIANMIIKRKLGTAAIDELKLAWKHLKKAESLGNIAAINTIGLCYKEGIGVEKDLDKALTYFTKAGKENYAYAFNNLGRYYEDIGNFKKAFTYYMKSANLGESWAANKIGEMYRKGMGVKRDLQKAFEYYTIAEDTTIRELYWYTKYNLAKYFYLNGEILAGVEKNEEKAIQLFEEASANGVIEGTIELLYIYVKKYTKTKREEYSKIIQNFIDKIETNEKYNLKIGKEINKKLKEIKKIGTIN